ncbi:MAG: polysaccharide deacetylase family protein [Bacteroidetes bacterium]|nr:polysaccharide deacetylase family protein [Bacteroidota bacterium]
MAARRFYGLHWAWAVVLLFVYVSLLALGAIYIRWNFFLKSFNKGANQKCIALTFDDGPGQETAAILNILKAQNVPAAFFCIGKNASTNVDLLKRIDAEGHLAGNHSYNHGFNFDWQSANAMAAEMRKTNEAIAIAIGKTPKLFRPPYGVTNPNLAKAVGLTYMRSIGWSLRSFDTKVKDPQVLLNRVLSKLQGGDIILLHDTKAITREILTDLIINARKKGFTFVRIDKMLSIDAYA